MNLTDILAQAGGIESMAKELGVPPAMAKQGADALLPAILGGFKKQAQAGGGLGGLGGLLGQLGGGGNTVTHWSRLSKYLFAPAAPARRHRGGSWALPSEIPVPSPSRIACAAETGSRGESALWLAALMC